MTTVDVLIAGGGVMGSAIAYFLAADPDFTGQAGDRARSELSIRVLAALFGRCAPTVQQSGKYSDRPVRSPFRHPRRPIFGGRWRGPGAELPRGRLFVFGERRGLATLRENHAVQTGAGATIDLLSPDALAARFPWINVAGLAGASPSAGGEGWLDPFALLQGFRKARALGVEFIADKVTGVQRANGRVVAVDLASGRRVAPGCWSMPPAPGPARWRRRPASLCRSSRADGWFTCSSVARPSIRRRR